MYKINIIIKQAKIKLKNNYKILNRKFKNQIQGNLQKSNRKFSKKC